MNRGLLLSLLVLACAAAGCAANPEEATPKTDPGKQVPMRFFAADDYDAAFDAVVNELRDRGYRIARNDRRFGVITTYPKESPTLFEPWVGDNTTGDVARRSTLNHLRRAVTVELQPYQLTLDEQSALDRMRQEGREAIVPEYVMTVRVDLERLQEPNRYLTHSARGRITASYRDVPARLAQRGIPSTYWEPAGTDAELARQLIGRVRSRSGAAIPRIYIRDIGPVDP